MLRGELGEVRALLAEVLESARVFRSDVAALREPERRLVDLYRQRLLDASGAGVRY